MKFLFLLFTFFSFTICQAQHQGTYVGQSSGSKIVGTIKCNKGIVVGSFYENKKTKSTLLGTYSKDDSFDGRIDFKMFGNVPCEGSFSGDSLVIKVFAADIEEPFLILLKKKNNSLNADIDGFFGKPEHDISLVGDWKLINIIDTKTGEISPKVYDIMSINKNGELYYKGYKWAKFSPATQRKINTSWFTVNNEFYFHIDSEGANINYDSNGYHYTLKSDTLEFKSSYQGKEIIGTHIRLK